jgi:TrmH family RNA methyltransferase
MITSVSNPMVKLVAGLSLRKNRLESKLFIVEGIHLAQEALKAGAAIYQYFWTPKLPESGEGRELLALLEGRFEGFEVHEAVMAKMAETEHPQGILLTVHFPKPKLLEMGGFTLGLVLDGLQDPGNTGTIIRTAWAAGANALLFIEGTADPYQGKVVRASMGGIFHLPIYTSLLPEAIIRAAVLAGVQLVAADAAAPLCYTEANLAKPSLLLFGSEGRGFSAGWEQAPLERVSIPQPGRADSLNVAVCAGILTYEFLRQRHFKITCQS